MESSRHRVSDRVHPIDRDKRAYIRAQRGESGYLVIRVLVTEKEMPTNEKIGRGERKNG